MFKTNIIELSNKPFGVQGFYVCKIDTDHRQLVLKTLTDKEKNRHFSHNLTEMYYEEVCIRLNWPVPTNVKTLQRFLGFVNYHHNKIVMSDKMVHPLYDLLRKDVEWNWPVLKRIYMRSFRLIKTHFREFRILMANIEQKFIFKTDTCKMVISYLLTQHKTDSKVFKPAERSYSINELEKLVKIFRVTKQRYIDDVFFTKVTWFNPFHYLGIKQQIRLVLTAHGLNRTFIRKPGVLHTYTDGVSRINSHNPTPTLMSLLKKENPFKFKTLTVKSKIKENFQKPLSELYHVQNMNKQSNSLERIPNTSDPWKDINLLKYIKYGYHDKSLSSKKMRRIELIVKKYFFFEETLFFRCDFDFGEIPVFKTVPSIETREVLVRRAHYLGHFSFDKTYSLLNDRFHWPSMSRDVKFEINSCT
jgi:hypothetical protein